MALTSSDDCASAAFGTRGRTWDGIFQVAAEFDLTNLIEEGFYAENEKSILSAVIATRMCSEPLKRGGRRRLKMGEPLSHLEQLPYEIVMSVLEQIDISSLVAMASVNTHVWNFPGFA
jgi:F-box domain